jgi:hypothetical protein
MVVIRAKSQTQHSDSTSEAWDKRLTYTAFDPVASFVTVDSVQSEAAVNFPIFPQREISKYIFDERVHRLDCRAASYPWHDYVEFRMRLTEALSDFGTNTNSRDHQIIRAAEKMLTERFSDLASPEEIRKTRDIILADKRSRCEIPPVGNGNLYPSLAGLMMAVEKLHLSKMPNCPNTSTLRLPTISHVVSYFEELSQAD